MKEVQARLYQADLHGCLLRVAESPQAHRVGASGIVVRDSQDAFHLVTPQDKLIIVAKKPCVFEYKMDARRVVVLLGAGLAAAGRGQGGSGSRR